MGDPHQFDPNLRPIHDHPMAPTVVATVATVATPSSAAPGADAPAGCAEQQPAAARRTPTSLVPPWPWPSDLRYTAKNTTKTCYDMLC